MRLRLTLSGAPPQSPYIAQEAIDLAEAVEPHGEGRLAHAPAAHPHAPIDQAPRARVEGVAVDHHVVAALEHGDGEEVSNHPVAVAEVEAEAPAGPQRAGHPSEDALVLSVGVEAEGVKEAHRRVEPVADVERAEVALDEGRVDAAERGLHLRPLDEARRAVDARHPVPAARELQRVTAVAAAEVEHAAARRERQALREELALPRRVLGAEGLVVEVEVVVDLEDAVVEDEGIARHRAPSRSDTAAMRRPASANHSTPRSSSPGRRQRLWVQSQVRS
jgi:hypothetical protein